MPTPPPVPPAGSFQLKLLNAGTALNTLLYRLSGGRIGGRFGKAPVLLLHHVGKKTGTERVSPLLYVPDGENVAIVASAGGRQKHPAWFHNLNANPDTVVEIGREKRRVRARHAEGEERERLWREACRLYPDYDVYQSRTERQIPVLVLERTA